jgi:hypothetical protein
MTKSNRYGHSCSVKLGLVVATDHHKGVMRWDGLEVTMCPFMGCSVPSFVINTKRTSFLIDLVNYRPRWYRHEKGNWEGHFLGWSSRQNRETVKLKLPTPSRSLPLSILLDAPSMFIVRTGLSINFIATEEKLIFKERSTNNNTL